MQTNYEEIEFTKKIRITEEDLEYLRKIKGKTSMARKLQQIIGTHKALSNCLAPAKRK